MLMTTLNPSQIQVVNNFKSKPREEQAKMISDVCNEKGITKEQLEGIMNTVKNLNII